MREESAEKFRPCCDAWRLAHEEGTDNECAFPLIWYASDDDDVRPRTSTHDSGLPPIRYCPWCGSDKTWKPGEMAHCPHCGSRPRLHTTPANQDSPGISYVLCDGCGAQGGTPRGALVYRCAHHGLGISEAEGIAAHDAEAVRLWNARAPAASADIACAVAEECERCAKLCDELESRLPYGEGAGCAAAIRRSACDPTRAGN